METGWVSPEVYLRRPPSENEKYRLDRMLLAAAERGVKVNIIVFKEVPQFMYRKYCTFLVFQILFHQLSRFLILRRYSLFTPYEKSLGGSAP